MSVFVPMNIRCIGEECIGCKDLEIDNNQYMVSTGIVFNNLFCINYGKCERIKKMFIEESEKQNEQK